MNLCVENLRTGYGKLEIIQGVSLVAPAANIVGIIGPNGAGKSTLLRAIFGFLKLFSGTVTYGSHDLTGQPTAHVVRQGIGYVAQARGLFPQMSVLENLIIGGYTLRSKTLVDQAIERALDVFPFLKDRRQQQAGTMSGGEQRLLSIARALMTDPKMLLLDEPSAALSVRAIDEVYQTLDQLRAKGLGLLIVEQNVEVIMSVADRIYVLDVGRNAFEGSSEELRGMDRIRRLYLGEQESGE